MTCYFTHSPLELKSKTHSSWLIKILKFDIKLEYSLFYPQDLESSITLVPVYNETFKIEEICCVCVCVCVCMSCLVVSLFNGILQARTVEWVAISFSKRNYRKKESEVAQSCLTLCNPMDSSLPGSSIHGIFQARVLEWVAISFSKYVV